MQIVGSFSDPYSNIVVIWHHDSVAHGCHSFSDIETWEVKILHVGRGGQEDQCIAVVLICFFKRNIEYCRVDYVNLAAFLCHLFELLVIYLLKCQVSVTVSKHGNKVGVWGASEPRDGCDAARYSKLPWRRYGWLQFTWFRCDRRRHKQARLPVFV